MKVLFICNQNIHRSKTAERIFKDRFETKSTDIYNDTPVTELQIEWADLIVVMEEHQRDEIKNKYHKQYLKKQIICLDIPDIYYYNQPALINLLESKFKSLY